MTRDPSHEPFRVGIAGVTAYTGQQAARLVAGHPGFRTVAASSDAMAGKALTDLDPDLVSDRPVVLVGQNDTVAAARDHGVELMLLATTPQQSDAVASDLLAAGIRVVDLSGAHRLRDIEAHVAGYGFVHRDKGLAHGAVYGLTEWADREAIAGAELVTNPGGFPTAALLGLLPLIDTDAVRTDSLVIDAKSGTTAAGRSARVSLLHSEISENVYADRVGCYRHTPEITQGMRQHGAGHVALTFVAHAIPVRRGIIVAAYLPLAEGVGITEALDRARLAIVGRYAGSPFVRVLERPEDVRLSGVVHTNRCLLGVTADAIGRRLVVVSAVDNLLKGGAGQAIQNANLMFGFPETTGLALGTGGVP